MTATHPKSKPLFQPDLFSMDLKKKKAGKKKVFKPADLNSDRPF